jgi:hypothetical protein
VQENITQTYSDNCIFVPGLPHLSEPILKVLSEKITANLYISKFPDFGGCYYPVNDFGFQKIDFSENMQSEYFEFLNVANLFREVTWILSRRKSTYLKQERVRLLERLEELNPSVIYATSDQNLFIYFLIGTKFEKRVVIVQPALITFRRKGIRDLLILGGMKLLNRLDRVRSRPEELNWGSTLKQGTAFMWSSLEAIENIACKCLVSGGLFMESSTAQVLPPAEDYVLIIAPNLSVESEDFCSSYIRDILWICNELPGVKFTYRRHPSDTTPMALGQTGNIKESRNDLFSDHLPRAVISSASALAVQVRRQVRHIAIFDNGKFAKYGGPYFSDRYFFVDKNPQHVVEYVGELFRDNTFLKTPSIERISEPNSSDPYLELFIPGEEFRIKANDFLLQI